MFWWLRDADETVQAIDPIFTIFRESVLGFPLVRACTPTPYAGH